MSDQPRWRRDLPVGRPDLAALVDAELEFHREALIQDLIREGRSPEEARREAARRLNALPGVRRELVEIDRRRARKGRRIEHLGELGDDVRFALRGLRTHKGFAAMAILALGLGIGATTTILSATYAILIRSLPYRDADRLVAIYAQVKEKGWHGINISYQDYRSWQEQNRTFADIGMWTWTSRSLSGDGEAERVDGAAVTANLFRILGVDPILGRHFVPEEERPNGPNVVILGYGLWQRRYGADPKIIGRSIMVEGRAATVVGVMPRGFGFPDRGQVWTPFVPDPGDEDRGNRGYAGAIGRLGAGVTLERAAADLELVSKRLQTEFPKDNRGWEAEPIPLRRDLVGDLERPLQIFLGAALLVLLIVCANVANLMLARGADRRRELAVRIAIGAGRRRLIRQLVTEALVLSFFGGALGFALSFVGLRLFRLAFPNDVPFYLDLGVDGTVLWLTAAVSIVTGVLFGTVPALRSTAVELTGALKDGARGGEGIERSRFRRALVVAELALSFALLVGAGLLIRTYGRLTGTDLGFREHGILSARITLPNGRYDDPARSAAFFAELLERLRHVPGVESVGSAQGIPFSGWNVQSEMTIEGRPARRPGEELDVHFQAVTPGFFPTIGVPILAGRGIEPTDRDTANQVGVINETLAKQEFAGIDPIGKRIRWGDESKQPWITIVGVARDYRHYRLPQPMGPAIYLSFFSLPGRSQTVVLRTGLDDPHRLEAPLRAALKAIDPNVPTYAVQTFDEAVSRSLWRQRLQGQTLGIFAVLALVLATVGIYGVISYSVAQRTRELGVRMALGATGRNVQALVIRQGMRLAVVGLGLGWLLAIGAARLLRGLVDGVVPADPILFAIVLATLIATALLACWLPARRAATVDPLLAMRTD